MYEKQYNLCFQVLKKLSEVGLLEKVILIGSWCIPIYKEHFFKDNTISPIRTRDLDFLVPNPDLMRENIDLPELLKEFGFIEDFVGEEGYVRLVHPQLFIEFLVHEKGRGTSKPYPLYKLNLNAQQVRFLDMLAINPLRFEIDGISLTLPHPANFALQKLIASERRQEKDKAEKDTSVALEMLISLIDENKQESIISIYKELPPAVQKRIKKILKDLDKKEILEILR